MSCHGSRGDRTANHAARPLTRASSRENGSQKKTGSSFPLACRNDTSRSQAGAGEQSGAVCCASDPCAEGVKLELNLLARPASCVQAAGQRKQCQPRQTSSIASSNASGTRRNPPCEPSSRTCHTIQPSSRETAYRSHAPLRSAHPHPLPRNALLGFHSPTAPTATCADEYEAAPPPPRHANPHHHGWRAVAHPAP
jgi:hypothetical protein